jgi:hypothetical protein
MWRQNVINLNIFAEEIKEVHIQVDVTDTKVDKISANLQQRPLMRKPLYTQTWNLTAFNQTQFNLSLKTDSLEIFNIEI